VGGSLANGGLEKSAETSASDLAKNFTRYILKEESACVGGSHAGWEARGNGTVVTLVFVAVLLAAFVLDVWLIRPWEAKHRPPSSAPDDASLEFVVPRTLFFHPGHTWARLDGDGLVTVGVDDLARTVIGDLEAVELPAVGEHLTAGQPALTVRQKTRRLRLVAPVSGTVTEVNAAIGRDPVRLRWRPYKEGWSYRVAPSDQLSVELGRSAISRDAESWMRVELDRLGLLFEDGTMSPPVEGALQRAGDDVWARFERDFLKIDPNAVELV
jgi:glycine cleavage system H lipoate-binding protein